MNHEVSVDRPKLFTIRKCAIGFAMIFSIVLLFFGFLLFSQYVQMKEEEQYILQMEKAYALMNENATQAQKILNSYSYQAAASPVTSASNSTAYEGISTMYEHYQENGDIAKLSENLEECQHLLSQLPIPTESLMETYSLLLDAHILYREYINLALQPAEDSLYLKNQQEFLHKELETKMNKVRQTLDKIEPPENARKAFPFSFDM
ncbi:MAG TPA: hypothetical protein VEY51_01200 [Chondromyces sp.]|nr:hypothetical protein [Chondromyces sp.]